MDEIKELGSSRAGGIHCLTIIGSIEGHQTMPEDTKTTKYEHIMPLLAAVEESEEINRRLNAKLNELTEEELKEVTGGVVMHNMPKINPH